MFINCGVIKLSLLPQNIRMEMKWKTIESIASRRTFSGLLGGCLFLTEYKNRIRG
jgi:hypothetical protein